MTGLGLVHLISDEIRRARLRLQFEIRRGPTGCFLMLWSDLAWMTGIGGRRFLGRDDIRRRESNIGILVLHSRVPTITYGGEIGGVDPLQTLCPPPRCPEPILRALVFNALAATVPTPWRLRQARRRLRAAGVRLSDFRRKPPLGHRASA